MARVVLRQLRKSFPDRTGADVPVVKGVDLEIRDGEFMVLVGPSGCGKSTTLRMVAGLEAITGGTIAIEDRVVNDVAPKDRDIAMVFQNYALYPHMSVYENMAFGLKLRKFSRTEIDTRVREAAGLLGLEALLDRKPKELSGGQRQRVAVGRAIVRKPKVFLFDEPLSNLDAKMRVTMRAEISRLHERLKSTVIYVTHDQVEAMTMGDRICVMKDGSIMQVAEPLELYDRPANLFVAGFIGSPPMNFLRGHVEPRAGGSIFVTTEQMTVALSSRYSAATTGTGERVLGVRPENVRVEKTPHDGSFAAQVELIEPMGAETFLYLKAGAAPVTARVRPSEQWRVGEQVAVSFEPERLHLFDAVTEQRIN